MGGLQCYAQIQMRVRLFAMMTRCKTPISWFESVPWKAIHLLAVVELCYTCLALLCGRAKK